MTRTEFSAWCSSVRLLDGATGSMLRAAGMPAGVCSERWILSHPQLLLDLQRAYSAAGSDVIYAPTFMANRIGLSAHGLEDRLEEMNRRLVALSKEAAGGRALVAGDVTTTGRPLEPVGSMEALRRNSPEGSGCCQSAAPVPRKRRCMGNRTPLLEDFFLILAERGENVNCAGKL